VAARGMVVPMATCAIDRFGRPAASFIEDNGFPPGIRPGKVIYIVKRRSA